MQTVPDKNDLRQKVPATRPRRDTRIWFSAPGSKHYESRSFKNQAGSFANISITGKSCALGCAHCNARLLQSMLPAEIPEKLRGAVDHLIDRGCRGILVSGGADSRGEVPLRDFMLAIESACKRGLKVLVHTGLLQKETAKGLKDCGVNQILMDIIGHEQTIHDVYHLDRTPDDYLRSMMICQEAGLDFAPHVVIGLHYGRILGEYEALKMIHQAHPKIIVMVILAPMSGT
ncbi:MAG: radical SAM protein, partial [Smithella sp.]